MSSSATGPAFPTLIVTGGPSDGVEVQIASPGGEKTIGSAPSSHLRLTSQNVDATHARVVWDDGGVVLNDEGSAAGTYVNGERVASGHVLQDGDRISVGPPGSPGSVRLLVRVPADLSAAAEAAPFVAAFAPDGTVVEPEAVPVFAAEEPVKEDVFVAAPDSDEPVVFEEAAEEPAFPPASTPVPAPTVAAPAAPPVAAPPVAAPAAAPPVAASAPAVILDAPAAKAATPDSPRPPARSRAAADYMTEMPSIGGDRVREAPDLPHEPAPARPARRARPRITVTRPPVPRAILLAVGAAALSAAAWFIYSRSQQPPPVITALTPAKAEAGKTITITGTGFEPSASDNVVRFGDATAAVTNASATSLAVTVPQTGGDNTTRELPVTVQGKGGRSNALFVKIARLPRVTRLEPDVALPGTEIVLHGQNLDGAALSVRIAGEKVEVKDVTADSMRVKVPPVEFTDGQSVNVSVEVGADAARPMPLLLGRLPFVTELAPSSGPVGQRVAIRGRGFDATPSANRVTVGGVPALVLTSAPAELHVAIPAAERGGTQTSLPVAVEVRGTAAATRPVFMLSHPLTGLVRLRFFPAPVPEAPADHHAYVATELGPVLLLSGKGDAPSVGERAARVAAAATSVVEASMSRPVTFEVRDTPNPTVAVAGGETLVSVSAEDAEGYAQKWEPGLKASRATPRQVAAYWAALLQDYALLFGQGQRPSRTAELSPRGRVLVDLYSEAQRRASGGVPVATVASLSPAALRSFREMALVVPGAATASGAAVAGRWEGTMADNEAERRIEVELAVDGGRLAGSLTTKTGALAVRTPLQQVSYDKGQLKFVTASGGSTRQFRGTLEGATLSGSIFKDGAAKDAVGKFNLRYIE